MVHRPADSRLLANLLAHEKEHAKALHQLSTTAQASLAPLAAYAAASTPSAAAALGAAARALSQADGALRAYAEAVDEWRAMLSELKGLEDEVGNIQRDREILVTRLIKASNIKPTSPNRNSFIGVTSSTYSTNNSSKLDLAQSELQACETHLASRERDLQALRALALSRGLKGRCTAMSECGWQWNEAGKEGLRALEEMDRALPNGFTADSALVASQFHKPLPDPKPLPVPDHVRRPSSDISSSLAPSQSASQIAADEGLPSADISPNIGSYDSQHPLPLPPSFNLPPTHPYAAHITGTPPRPGARGLLDLPSPSERQNYRLSIPPAHSISDHHIPPRIERRITEGNEEDDEGGSSVEEGGEVDEEMDANLEVHENRPFENALALAAGQKAANLNAVHMNGDARPPEETIRAPAPFTPMRMDTLNNAPVGGGNGTAQSDVGPRRRSPPPRRRASPDHSPAQTFKRERKGSFFGTIAGLFRTHPRTGAGGGEGSTASGSQPPSPVITRSSPSKVSRSGRWRVRSTRRTRKDDDDSDDDEDAGGMSDTAIDYGALARKSALERKALPVPRSPPAIGGVNGAGAGASGGSSTTVTMPVGAQTGKRLTKKSRRGGKAGAGAGASSRPEGWMKEGIVSPPADVNGTVRQRKLVNGNGTAPPPTQEGTTMTVMRSGTVRSTKSNASAASASATGGTMKKKKSPSGSAVSAPPTTPTSPTLMTKRKPVRATSLDYTHGAAASPSRTYALSSAGSDAQIMTGVGAGTKRSDTWSPKHSHGHGHGHSADLGRPGASLMTIVEGVTRANRDAWARDDPNALLVGVKAPPPVTDFSLDDQGQGLVRHPISRSEVNLNDGGTGVSKGRSIGGEHVMTGVGANGSANTVMRRLSSASTPNLATTGPSVVAPPPSLALHAPTPKHETPPKIPVPLRSALRNRTPSPILPLRNGPVIQNAPALGVNLSPSPAARGNGHQEAAVAGMSSNGDATLKSSDIPAAPHNHTPLTASAAATSVNKNHGMDDTASITSQETNDVFEDAEEFVVTTPSAEEHPELATPKAATNDFSFSSAQSGATLTDTHAHMGDATAGNANGAGKSIPLSPEAIAAIPVPPVPIAPPPNPPHGGSEVSYSSGSTSTAMGAAPPRKKSVRVSLQPTFSPTPPAIDYEDDDEEEGEGDGAHPPWSGQKEKEKSGWPSREHKTGDAAWDDSSDEDEEYAQARRLLAKVERRMEKVKKRVGGSRRNADD